MDKKNEAQAVTDEMLFIQMVSLFQAAAMQHLGKIMDPVTNKIEQDLDQAKASIDMIGMIKNKTRGNLGEAEEAFLDKVLFELRMNYVEEVDRLRKRKEEGKAGGGGTEKEAASSGESEAVKEDAKPQGDKTPAKASGKARGHARKGARKKGAKKKAKGVPK